MKFKNKHYLCIILLFLVAAKIYLFFRGFLVTWDEAVYIGMGKHIYSFGSIGLWEIIRPPAMPLLLGFFWLIKLNPLIIGSILELFFSLGTVYLTYLITKKLFNERTALLAALIMAFTPIFFFYSLKIFTGIPSTFFALLAIYFFIDKKYFVAGIFTGISFLFRYPQGILLIALLSCLLFVYSKRKKMLILKNAFLFCLAFFIVQLPYLLFNLFYYKNPLKPYITASLHQGNLANAVPGFLNNLFFYPLQLFLNNPLFIFAILALVIIWKEKNIRFLLVPLLLYLLYFTYITNKQLRFSLLFLPFIVVLTAYVFDRSFTFFKKKQLWKWLYVVILVLGLFYCLLSDFSSFKVIPLRDDNMINNYYNFFPSGTTVITSDPVPVAYNDIKMFHYYDKPETAFRDYKEFINKSQYIIYNRNAFVCVKQGCEEQLFTLFDEINKNILLSNTSYYGDAKYIYLNKDFR